MRSLLVRALISRLTSTPLCFLQHRCISGEEFHQVDWSIGALKYLRYIGVDIPNMIRIYKRLGKTKYFTRDNVANLVEYLDQVGVRGPSIKNSIICAPDLLRVPHETLDARGCWYRYVFGLTHQQFRDVVEIYPNLLEDKATDRFEEALQYFQELGISNEQFKGMMLKSPTFLQHPIHDSIAKMIDFFAERDVPKSDIIAAILDFPELLQYSLIGHILPKAHYFENELGISEKQFAQVFVKHGWVLGLNLEGDIRHTVQWLLDFGASKSVLGKVILQFPAVLGYSVENNFKPKLDYFVHYLGMPFEEVARIIEKYPAFAGTSLKENILPLVWCMEHEIEMPSSAIKNVFIKAPELFGISYAEIIRPTIRYFLEEVVCTHDQFAQMLSLYPQVLCYSLDDNIKPRIQWLRETVGISEDEIKTVALHKIYEQRISSLNNKLTFIKSQLNITHEQIRAMIVEDASILHKSLGNLAKKIAFLEETLKKPRSEIVSMPQFLGYSLDSRIQPRIQHLHSINKDPQMYTLQQLFSCTDEEFTKSLSDGTYLEFKEQKLKDIQSNEDEDDQAEEAMLEQTFLQEQDIVPIEEIREAERRFSTRYKYQSVLE